MTNQIALEQARANRTAALAGLAHGKRRARPEPAESRRLLLLRDLLVMLAAGPEGQVRCGLLGGADGGAPA